MNKVQKLLSKLTEFQYNEETDDNNPHLELTMEEVIILNELLSYYI